ncbi:MAG: lipopolysaccharide kinase InaA family protein, partial [Myxococcota bacterium]
MQGRWRVHLEEPSLAAALEPILEVLARGERPPGAVPIKRSRAREVFRLELATGESVYGKRDRIERDGFAGLRWRRPPARREYANLKAVREAGFPAVEPLALAECQGPRGRELWLFTRALDGAHPLGRRLREGGTGIAAERLAEAAALARRLHEAGFWHRDLHPGNLLVRDDGLHLVDLQKLRAPPFPLPLRLRARDLVGLVGDGRPERRALPHAIAEAYCRALPDGPDPKPFAALLDRTDGRHLVEEYALRYLPTASVVLKLNGPTLQPSQVAAIQHLVATAVPGLQPTRISVIDSNGRLLARGGDTA